MIIYGKENGIDMTKPKRRPVPRHPINRETDPYAYDDYQKWLIEREVRKEQYRQEADEYYKNRDAKRKEASEQLNHSKDVVMSALSDTATSTPFTGSEVKDAAEEQRQEKLDKVHQAKNVADATATVGEWAAAGYGLLRALAHYKRFAAKQAMTYSGRTITNAELRNLRKWDKWVAKIDKPQAVMTGVGGLVDGYQLATADNSFDRWENGLETGANVAGFVGATDVFKNLPGLRRIGGDRIDAVLDGLGYSAATWDIIKTLPPLSGALENIRSQSKRSLENSGNK